ncbi:MAG: ABC transporter permease [Desulforhopalus sp.]|nr:ABC transporter permease [Desulforhopalus sp.]
MQDFSMSFREMGASLWRNRYLLKKSVQREVIGRYRGSAFGVLWSLFQPIFMLAVYTFVFSVVFKARWHGGSDSKTEFALILFSGLMVFNLFAECINRAPNLILNNVNYVKRVIFPLDILPWVVLGGAIFNAGVSFLVWLVADILLRGIPPWTIILYPVTLAPLCILTVGLSFFLSSLGVFIRDIAQMITIVTTALLFLTPIFFAVENLPPVYHLWLNLNPLSGIVEQCRGVLLWGKLPDVTMLFLQYTVSILICWLGFAWFQKTRKGFADVI